jgi:hypothetical protein
MTSDSGKCCVDAAAAAVAIIQRYGKIIAMPL